MRALIVTVTVTLLVVIALAHYTLAPALYCGQGVNVIKWPGVHATSYWYCVLELR